MYLLRSLFILITLVSVYTACSEVKFNKQVDLTQYAQGCGRNGDVEVICEGTEYIEGGKVDILFVNDNSASMSFEQAKLVERFRSFITLLDQKHMNYRIAIITTDISSATNGPRAINQNGALQDGKLISLENGKKFISSTEGTADSRTALFNKALKRQETVTCETFITNWKNSGKSMSSSDYDNQYTQNCPSSDERGIYAANLVLKNNPEQFIRPEADFALVFLSDEDVRSQFYTTTYKDYTLEDLDKAGSLVSSLNSLFPGKAFGVHALITTTEACLTQQNTQINGVVNGSYGWEYKRAVDAAKSEMIKRGVSDSIASKMVVGDICGIKKNYTTQLTEIFDHIQGQIKDTIELSCEGATGVQVTISTDSSIDFKVEGKILRFNKKIPVGSHVSYRYSCPI